MKKYTSQSLFLSFGTKPKNLEPKVKLTLVEYSESSFTDPHTVVDLEEPRFDENAYSHIGKIYEGVEPHRMGGHSVVQDKENPKKCVHRYDPNYRDSFVVAVNGRRLLETLCISTRFFAGNPASNLTLTVFDDVQKHETIIEMTNLTPDNEHWLTNLSLMATRIALHFTAGGITRIWAYGTQKEQQQQKLVWLSKDSTVLFDEDDFFGGPNFALSQKADRSNEHMLGWETSRSAMGLQAVFPIEAGIVQEVVLDTYRHVNNYFRSAWVFGARLPKNHSPSKAGCPAWHITSSDGKEYKTKDLKKFFSNIKEKKDLPTFTIEPVENEVWTLETAFELKQDSMHTRTGLSFDATHICIMLLPHGGLHAIKIMGTPHKN